MTRITAALALVCALTLLWLIHPALGIVAALLLAAALFRPVRRLSLAALLLVPLAACNPADLSAINASGLTPTLAPGALSPQALAASGLPPATQAKITKAVATVQAAAAKICPFLPLGESVANIFVAQANQGVASNVAGVARLTCQALTTAPTYTALGRRGEPVRGHVLVGAIDVPVDGTRIR